jgi:hypothetical protein
MGVLGCQGIYQSFSDSVAFLYRRMLSEYIRTVYVKETSTC